MEFFTSISLEWYSIIISVLSFFAAIYAIIYTHLSNKLNLRVTGCYYDQRQPDPHIAHFTLENLSSKPVIVEQINFYDFNSKERIEPLIGFEPTQTYSGEGFYQIPDMLHGYYENVLDESYSLQPNSEASFSYYFNPLNDHMIIKVTLAKKRILTRRNIKKSFPVVMKQTN